MTAHSYANERTSVRLALQNIEAKISQFSLEMQRMGLEFDKAAILLAPYPEDAARCERIRAAYMPYMQAVWKYSIGNTKIEFGKDATNKALAIIHQRYN